MYERIKWKLRTLRPSRELKLFCQWFVRGWSDRDVWSLDKTIADFVLPRLIRFQEVSVSYPKQYSEEDWNLVLGEMIQAFEFYLDEDSLSKAERERMKQGFKLFFEHFEDLWS